MNDKIYYLEGIRVLSAISVVLSHLFGAFFPIMRNDNLISILLSFGEVPVMCFFIISGYVLPLKNFHQNDRRELFCQAVARYFRLTIPMLASFFIVYILMTFNLFYHIRSQSVPDKIWLSGLFNFIPEFAYMVKEALFYNYVSIGFNAYYNPVAWTMKYEMLGSLMVLFLLSMRSLRVLFWFFVILFCVVFVGLKDFFYCYLAMMLGFLLSYYDYRRGNLQQGTKPFLYGFILFCGLLLFAFPQVNIIKNDLANQILSILKPYVFPAHKLAHLIGAFFIIISVRQIERLKRLLSHNSLIKCAKLSLSIYLLHLPLFLSFSMFLFEKTALFIDSYVLNFLLTGSVSMVLLFFVSYGFYYIIDLPSIRWSRYVSKKVFASLEVLRIFRLKLLN